MSSLADFGFNAETFMLGNLCKRKHEFQDTGKTIRYCKQPYGCKICVAESAKRSNSKPENIERANKHKKKRYHERKNDPDFQKQTKEYLDKTRDKRNERKRQTYHRDKDKIREQTRRSRERNPETRNLPKIRYRHKKREVHIKYSAKQVRARIADFNYCCGYCNKSLKNASKFELQLDHLFPISRGGFDSIENLILSCKSCNTSKFNRIPLEWYKDQVFYCQERWDFILSILGLTEQAYEFAADTMRVKYPKPFSVYDSTTQSTLPPTT